MISHVRQHAVFAVKVRTIVQYGLWSVCAIVRY